MFCKKCDKEITGKYAGAHSRWCGHLKDLNRICKTCQKSFEDNDKRKSFCSSECRRIHTSELFKREEIRKKLSEARKSWLSKNPEKHPWKRNSKFNSEPCQKFKDALRSKSIDFHEEFTPLNDRFFAIDIAFPALKIGIEINGQQHYNKNGSLKQYYQKRHDLIKDAGWKLYEVHYSICFNEKRLQSLIDLIIQNDNLDKADLSFEITQRLKPASTKKFATRQECYDSRKLSSDKLKSWKEVIESHDPMKRGFIGKIAEKMCCSHTHARRILNLYFPDFQSYKRKSPEFTDDKR